MANILKIGGRRRLRSTGRVTSGRLRARLASVIGGIDLDGVDFFAELAFNNDKDWWTANKARWEASVRRPMEALCAALAPEFGDAKLFRPYRDVRFSADKTPYKDHQGAVVDTVPSMGFYVQLSAHGLMTGGGWYAPSPDQVERFRASVDADGAGSSLAGIVTDLVSSGFEMGGDELKTAPRGFAKDHPRIDLLRRKHLLASVQHGTPDWLGTGEVVERVRADWLAYRPLLDWLEIHVGPSEREPRR
ncbi:MAG TPA: DUF2461 domain-containing protein [Propioniciclava tarda]|nr:DUF2461 domain-containing protein [Propioniciclava tarda]